MPTDATGTPTSLGIRTYNTSADAPSGLGFNGAMADIDALLVARITKPTGLTVGDVPVWNGTTWVRPTGTASASVFLRGDGSWQTAGSTTYRKSTSKTVNTLGTAADLLNGEITLAAGVLGTTGVMRLTAIGDYLNNSGGTVTMPRIQLSLGGAVLLDTGTTAATIGTTATRGGWRLIAEIGNTGSASTQWASLVWEIVTPNGSTANNAFTTGEGFYVTAPATGNLAKAVGTTNAGTVNTALASALVLNILNGSASATVETKLFGALVEII